MIQKIVKFTLFSFLCVLPFTSAYSQKPGPGKGSLTYIKTTADPDATPLRTILENDRLYVASQSKGVYIYQLVTPDSLKELAHYNESGLINGGIVKKDQFLYLSDGLNGILTFDVTGDNLALVNEVRGQNDVFDLAIKNDVLYAAESKSGLSTYKLLPDGKISFLSNYKSVAKWALAWRTVIKNDTLFVIDQAEGVKVFRITNPESPEYLTSFKTNGTPKDLWIEKDVVYIANGPDGLTSFSLNAAGYTRQIENIEIKGDAQAIIKSGRYFFLAAGDDGIYIMSETAPNRLGTDFKTKEPGEIISLTKRNEDLYIASNKGIMYYKYNSPPVINPIRRQTIDENQVLVFERSGYDPDGAKLIISAEGLPEGAEWDIEKRKFTWKPNFEQSGKYKIYFAFTEDTEAQLYDLDTVQITVNHVNRGPAIAAIPAKIIDENKDLEFLVVSGTDEDREDDGKLVHFSRNLPEGATFDIKTLKFAWKPTYDQSGEYTVTIGVKDPAGLEATTDFKITVNHVNRPPVIASIGPKTVDEMADLQFSVKWSDPDTEDQGKLIMNATGLPEGAAFNASTGDFTWKPTYEQSGTYKVKFHVEDSNSDGKGILSDEEEIPITVNHVSRTPIIVAVPDQQTKEDQLLSFSVRVYDLDREDFNKLKITATDLPKGSVLKDSVFTWTPDYFQAGSYTVGFTVTEPSGLNASVQAKITVENVNRMPIIAAISSPVKGKEDSPVAIQFSIKDPDLEDLTLTLGQLPQGSVFTASSQTFTWTPDYEQAGSYPMKIKAVDPLGGSAEADLTVIIDNVNRFPVFAEIAAQQVNENSTLTFKVSATDPDRQKVGLSSGPLPEGASFDPATGDLNWKPTFEQSGDYTVLFKATDEENAVTEKTIAIKVLNVNRLPEMAALQPVSGKENTPVTVQASATDPDRQIVTYSSSTLPAGARLNASTGLVEWTPTFEQAGTYSITLTATDPEGGAVSQTVAAEISNVNRPPVFTSVTDLEGKEGETLSARISATDPDGQVLTLSKLTGALPANATFNETTGQFEFRPDYTQAGTYGPFEVTATDPEKASVSARFSVKIENTNRKPVLSVPGEKAVTSGEKIEFTVSATDADNEKLTLTAGSLPAGASFDSASGVFTWLTAETVSGSFSVKFTVTDGLDSVSAEVSLTVTPKPVPVPQPQGGQ